jgi:hypothetical protein
LEATSIMEELGLQQHKQYSSMMLLLDGFL